MAASLLCRIMELAQIGGWIPTISASSIKNFYSPCLTSNDLHVIFMFNNLNGRREKTMRILILGGTVFLGRALTEAALMRGHEVTLFHRGQSNPDIFPQVNHILGDRTKDLSALDGRQWDAVIDTSGYLPKVVQASAEKLQSSGHYTFISSVSAYRDFITAPDEDTPVAQLQDASEEKVTNETYGPLKALCEQAAETAMPGRVLIIRPGLIVGPYDPTDRFSYWPYRVTQGGEVLAPGDSERKVQFIDVRDLAEWNLRMVEQGKTGVFNATGPYPSPTMEELLENCKSTSGSSALFTWVSESFLLDQGVEPWIEMPLWVPQSDPELAGFFEVNISKAMSAGLTFRLMTETVQATLDWLAERSPDHSWRAGLRREREAELLLAWKQAASDIKL